MWLWVGGPPQRSQPHKINQVLLFGPLLHQKALSTSQCDGNHLLPSNSHLSQWRSCSWCMWPKVHITNVSMCVPQVEGFYMDPIKVGVHHETNLWQAQEIWWTQENVDEQMTWDNFLKLQNIAYLDWKHKKSI
jgi:hypothetical protein